MILLVHHIPFPRLFYISSSPLYLIIKYKKYKKFFWMISSVGLSIILFGSIGLLIFTPCLVAKVPEVIISIRNEVLFLDQSFWYWLNYDRFLSGIQIMKLREVVCHLKVTIYLRWILRKDLLLVFLWASSPQLPFLELAILIFLTWHTMLNGENLDYQSWDQLRYLLATFILYKY